MKTITAENIKNFFILIGQTVADGLKSDAPQEVDILPLLGDEMRSVFAQHSGVDPDLVGWMHIDGHREKHEAIPKETLLHYSVEAKEMLLGFADSLPHEVMEDDEQKMRMEILAEHLHRYWREKVGESD
ncbi:hypothetical protein LJC63_00635 [Ruminococcaceae bacterium OttesenSCG-928-L11]|nr:hypothetical protein [Ruminococcaceae bacterium OttesenSCG-928-L11]